MSKKLKPVPFFETEAEERHFWETHDSMDYVDWSKARPRPISQSQTDAAGGVGSSRRVGDCRRLGQTAGAPKPV